MRVFLFSLPVLLLASCTNMTSQSDILARAKAEVSVRESWADQAYIRVTRVPGYSRLTWQVTAGVLDQSTYPRYVGLNIVPGTEREMTFTAMGCMLDYGRADTCCPRRYQTVQSTPMEPVYEDDK